jgi:hypothetical protein
MKKYQLLIGAAILIIGASIFMNGYFIGEAIKTIRLDEEDKVLNLSQTATYMNMTEDELQGIIKTETGILNEYNNFSGEMFPYFIINDKFYFYKDQIDKWLIEASMQHKNYNTSNGWINNGPTK